MRRVKWVYGVAILLCFLVISVFANKESVAEAKSGKWMKDSKGYWYSYSDGTVPDSVIPGLSASSFNFYMKSSKSDMWVHGELFYDTYRLHCYLIFM